MVQPVWRRETLGRGPRDTRSSPRCSRMAIKGGRDVALAEANGDVRSKPSLHPLSTNTHTATHYTTLPKVGQH